MTALQAYWRGYESIPGAARATAAGSAPLSMKEIHAEVRAVRRARYCNSGQHAESDLLSFGQERAVGRDRRGCAARLPP